MSDETLKKLDAINVKSVLIVVPVEEIKKACSDESNYNRFISTISNILATEPAFFLMSEDLIKKAEEVLNSKRFDYTTSENGETINDTIYKLNKLKGLSLEDKKEQRTIYFLEQQKLRERRFVDSRDLLISIAQDFHILSGFAELRNDSCDLGDLLGTLNYATKTVPEYFEEYPHAKQIAINILQPLANSKGIRWFLPRRHSRKTIENIQKVKTIKPKEE